MRLMKGGGRKKWGQCVSFLPGKVPQVNSSQEEAVATPQNQRWKFLESALRK